MAVLVSHTPRRNDAIFQHTDRESSSAREWIEDMDTIITQAAVEMLLERLVRTADDEINDFNRGIDDAKALHHFGKSGLEEFFVQLKDDFLAGHRIVNVCNAIPDFCVKAFQLVLLF